MHNSGFKRYAMMAGFVLFLFAASADSAFAQRSALDALSGNALTDALGGVPEPLRRIAEAEARLRQMLTTPGASFAEMERVAVLSGNAPLGPGSQSVPS